MEPLARVAAEYYCSRITEERKSRRRKEPRDDVSPLPWALDKKTDKEWGNTRCFCFFILFIYLAFLLIDSI